MDTPHSAPGDLPLPDPFPDYLPCPHCGEPEVEVWCYQTRVQCHRCGDWFEHQPHDSCKIGPTCQAGAEWNHLRFIVLLGDEQDEPGDSSLG
jgi:hypothetical protein